MIAMCIYITIYIVIIYRTILFGMCLGMKQIKSKGWPRLDFEAVTKVSPRTRTAIVSAMILTTLLRAAHTSSGPVQPL